MERVRSELSQMDSEVKRARQRKEQQAQEKRAQEQRAHEQRAQEQRIRQQLLYNHMHLPRPPPYPGARPGRAALPRNQAVDEVLDLTSSPCSSPEPKATHANGVLGLNGVAGMSNIFVMRRGAGKGAQKFPETSHLEELISQEQQRERRPPLQHNMPPNRLGLLQAINTLKQHTALSVLQQNTLNPGHLLTPQQNSGQFSTQLLRHNGSKPDLNALTTQSMRVQQFPQHVNSMSQPPHLLQPCPIQQDGHQHSHALMHTRAHSLHPHARENQMPVSEPAPLSLKLGPLSQQGSLSSQSVTENPAAPHEDFSFNLDLRSSLGQPPYSLTPQAPPSPSFSSSSPGTSSHFSSDPQSSSLSDSISPSSLFAPSSERLTLPLPNGHCSTDAQDDRMARAGSADRRHSVIQFNHLDWETI